MSEVRIMPMPVPHPVWKDGEGGYPPLMQVCFRNGNVRNYGILDEVIQPKPHVISTEELMKLFKKNTYGYYNPKHAKK